MNQPAAHHQRGHEYLIWGKPLAIVRARAMFCSEDEADVLDMTYEWASLKNLLDRGWRERPTDRTAKRTAMSQMGSRRFWHVRDMSANGNLGSSGPPV